MNEHTRAPTHLQNAIISRDRVVGFTSLRDATVCANAPFVCAVQVQVHRARCDVMWPCSFAIIAVCGFVEAAYNTDVLCPVRWTLIVKPLGATMHKLCNLCTIMRCSIMR